MATYYVDGAVGDDGNAGTSEGAGNALATINAGVLKCTAAGDHLYIKASVTYALGNTSNYPLNGSTASPIITEGYTSTPGDGGQVTIDCASANDDGIYCTRTNHWWRNIIVKNSTNNGFNCGASDSCRWDNCQAIDNNNLGFFADNYCTFDSCVATGNDEGFYTDQYASYFACVSTGNNNYAVRSTTYHLSLINCVLAGGATAVIQGSYQVTIINCTIDGYNTDRGLYMTSQYYPTTIINTIFHDCTTGIQLPTAGSQNLQVGYNNLFNSCTLNSTGWTPTDNDVSGDPLFTDEANGDYTLGAGSPALGAGYGGLGAVADSVDIGAHQTATAAGTGTTPARIVLTS